MDNIILLNKSELIAENILDKAKVNNKGIYWKTYNLNEFDSNSIKQDSEGILSGACGVIIFLMELYKHRPKAEYKEVIYGALNWIERSCLSSKIDNSFYNGIAGVMYTFLQAADLFMDKKLVEIANQISLKKTNISRINKLNNILFGKSGTILGLLQLYSYSKDQRLLHQINLYLEELIKSTKHSSSGIYWDEGPDSVHSLCSYPRGSSGPGYLFLEMGRYLQNDTFFWLAEQAFQYEDNYYFEGTWPDFRLEINSKKKQKERYKSFKKRNLDFFTKACSIDDWENGNLGIALVRLHAYKLLKKRDHLDKVINTAEVVWKNYINREVNISNYTLLNGDCGKLVFFLRIFDETKDKKYQQYAFKIARRLVYEQESIFRNSEGNLSLFVGISGVGYSLLRMVDRKDNNDILHPQILGNCILPNSSNLNFLNADKEFLINFFLNNVFPRTASHYSNPSTSMQLNGSNEAGFLNGFIKGIKASGKNNIQSIFEFEMMKFKFSNERISNHLLAFKDFQQQAYNNSKLNKLKNHLEDLKVQLVEEALIFKNYKKYDLTNIQLDERVEGENTYILLLQKFYGVKEIILSEFSFLLLQNCYRPIELSMIVNDLKHKITEENEALLYKKIVEQQVLEFLKGGVLYAV